MGGAANIPGNTGESKSDVMNIDKTLTMEDVFAKYPGIWDKDSDEPGDLRGNDFMVWDQEIRDGYGSETYSDVPLLIPLGPFPPADYTACEQWRELFVNWLNHTFR